MELPKALANIDSKIARIALAAVLAVSTLFFFAGTDNGAHLLQKFGIQNGAAQAIRSAERALQETGDALKSFIGRSPGERGSTDILKGKAERIGPVKEKVGVADKPEQRALGKVFDKPSESITDTAAPQPVVTFLPDDAGGFSVPPPGLGSPIGRTGPIFSAPIIGGIGGGVIGGGGGGGGSSGPPPSPPPVTSPVPEPSTWALLLLGFGLLGASMRRRATAGASPIPKRARCCAEN